MDTVVILLVSGDRKWAHYRSVEYAIERLKPDIVIQGGASGADAHAYDCCMELEIPCLTVPAKWGTQHRAAGAIRNGEMLKWIRRIATGFAAERKKVKLRLYAFHENLEKSRGTADMVKKAKKFDGMKIKLFEK